MSNFNNDVKRVVCDKCGITFFTHYKTREICGSCDPDNDQVKTVRNWEK